MTDIELKDLIGGIQAIIKYTYKFIYAFVLARRESNKIFIEDIYKENENEKIWTTDENQRFILVI